MMTSSRKHLLVALLAGVMMLFGASSALAANGDIIPHGGYSTATDACLQCHDVHEAAGDYVLGRWSTVTYVCGSCHTLYQTPPSQLTGGNYNATAADDPAIAARWDAQNENVTSLVPGGTLTFSPAGNAVEDSTPGGSILVNYDPNYLSKEAPIPGWSSYNMAGTGAAAGVGQGSPYEAYETSAATTHQGHKLGTAFTLGDTIAFADGAVDALDYIPGGSNRLTAIRTPSVADSAVDVGYEYMLPTTSVSEFPVSLKGGLYCASCHSPHGQFSGFGVTGDITGDGVNSSNMISPQILNKLLSSRPNHSAVAADFDGGNWLDDGGREFCGKCHDKRMSSSSNLTHSHPDFACLECHGTESIVEDGSAATRDFPHTSKNPNLLTQIPDGLCINCHAPSALPLP